MISPQLDNQLLSSFLLTLDHRILDKGTAYTNYSSLFYPVDSYYQGQYIYSCPFRSLVNDVSISGANVISGLYINNNFVTIGQSGLQSINPYLGAAFFNSPLPDNSVVSGNYAVKDFSIKISDQPEWKLLFESEYIINGKYAQTPTGLPLDTETSPIIFLRTKSAVVNPIGLGGWEDNVKVVRAIVIADTEYSRTAVCNIMKNMLYSPLYITTNVPFAADGSYTGVNYDFTALTKDLTWFPWIFKVTVSDIPRAGDFKTINKNMAMVDFHLNTIIRHTP